MHSGRILWAGAAAAVLALALMLPALGQERLKDLAPQQRPKERAPDGSQQRLKDPGPPAAQQRLKDRPSDASQQGLPPQGRPKFSEAYDQLRLFGEALNTLEKQYVGNPDSRKLIEAAIRGMVKELDQKSEYMDAQEFRDLTAPPIGRAGVGLEFRLDGGRVAVVAALDGTPAERAGMGFGDIITHIDGRDLTGLTLRQVRDLLTGPSGTTAMLKIERGSPAEVLEFQVQREAIVLQAVKLGAERDIGYIRIVAFREGAYVQLAGAVASLKAAIGSRLKGFVIDLRNNPGGLLDQAVLCTDAFLDSGLIVELRGREDRKQHHAKPGDLARGLPLIVLVNGGTGAGAEIMAAALQDHKRARLVGARTAGSGTIQTIFPLGGPLGSVKAQGWGAVKLTTHHHYTPLGRALEGNGLQPDVEIARAGSEGPAGFVPADRSRDAQLQRALSLLRDGV
jgi:carboxyl-terminal processing protease